ncbi:MAG: hypothetical protein J5971_06685 [Prevotella sp.]|nr:hypothetical protein [Prevotella sp.]
MKRIYSKPLCTAAPLDGLQLLAGSDPLTINAERTTNTVLSREMIDEPAGVPVQNSVWDD